MWADATTLMRQAPMTVEVYLGKVVTIIDDQFGSGFAKKNPDLVGSLVNACVGDFTAGNTGIAINRLSEQLGQGQRHKEFLRQYQE